MAITRRSLMRSGRARLGDHRPGSARSASRRRSAAGRLRIRRWPTPPTTPARSDACRPPPSTRRPSRGPGTSRAWRRTGAPGTTASLAQADGSLLREYDIVATDREIEIAPGLFFPAWTYNGQVPGPTIRATEGDRVRVNFLNQGSHPHTIHFHGWHPPEMDGSLPEHQVMPGARFVYEFDADAVRPAPLSLPRRAAEAAHPQGPLRRRSSSIRRRRASLPRSW